MVDTTDNGEVKKANATMNLLNERIPDPYAKPQLRTNGKIDKRFKKNKVGVQPVSSEVIPVTPSVSRDEILFREACLVLMKTFEVRSAQGIGSAARIADEYVKMIHERFGK